MNTIKQEFKPEFFLITCYLIELVLVVMKITSVIHLYELRLLNQLILIPIFSIWIMYIFKDFYENNLKDLLFSYPISVFTLGVKKVILLTFFSYFIIFPLILIDDNILNMIFLYFSQLSLFVSLGFLLITITKNFELSLTLTLSYIVIELLTKGSFVPWPHVIIFETENLNQFSFVVNQSVLNFGYSFLILYFGHLILSIYKKI